MVAALSPSIRTASINMDQHGLPTATGSHISDSMVASGPFVKAPVGGGVPVVLGSERRFRESRRLGRLTRMASLPRRRQADLIPHDENTHEPRRFAPAAEFGFSRDSLLLYVIRRGEDRDWSLTAIEVSSGKERSRVVLPIPSDSSIAGFSVHPDGKIPELHH